MKVKGTHAVLKQKDKDKIKQMQQTHHQVEEQWSLTRCKNEENHNDNQLKNNIMRSVAEGH